MVHLVDKCVIGRRLILISRERKKTEKYNSILSIFPLDLLAYISI